MRTRQESRRILADSSQQTPAVASIHLQLSSWASKRASLAGTVRIMVGVRSEYRAVNPVGQEEVKQLHRPFPTDNSGPQLSEQDASSQPQNSHFTPKAQCRHPRYSFRVVQVLFVREDSVLCPSPMWSPSGFHSWAHPFFPVTSPLGVDF